MGDVNGDGLLDIFIAKDHDRGQHNELWVNQGNRSFKDMSVESGIQTIVSQPGEGPSGGGISWAAALVDYDGDGTVDIFVANDQPYSDLSTPQAYINLFKNDGTGHFTNVTHQVGLDRTGFWMGLSFGDLNGDGYMDLFATNFGDYLPTLNGPPYLPGRLSSRWFLGQKNGRFLDPGTGALTATPFGWGAAIADYDNDGNADIIYHGGMDFGPAIDASNSGTLLHNDGAAVFTRDSTALSDVTNRIHQNVQGLAVGDLNNDGFVDIVWVSDLDVPPDVLKPFAVGFTSPFNAGAFYAIRRSPTDDLKLADGSLSVQVNSGNRNLWVEIQLIGTAGIVPDGRSNRDGIGAIVSFASEGGRSVMHPIIGGSSYASQDGLVSAFGLGQAHKGNIEVLWPGGTRNRLYDVLPSERLLLPEIPCSYTDPALTKDTYSACVDTALTTLVQVGAVNTEMKDRLRASALRAFNER